MLSCSWVSTIVAQIVLMFLWNNKHIYVPQTSIAYGCLFQQLLIPLYWLKHCISIAFKSGHIAALRFILHSWGPFCVTGYPSSMAYVTSFFRRKRKRNVYLRRNLHSNADIFSCGLKKKSFANWCERASIQIGKMRNQNWQIHPSLFPNNNC